MIIVPIGASSLHVNSPETPCNNPQKIPIGRFIKADKWREIRAVGFELGSHYQMMGTNPAQNFGVVLLNSYLQQAVVLSWSWARERNWEYNTFIYISYTTHLCWITLSLCGSCILCVWNLECNSCFSNRIYLAAWKIQEEYKKLPYSALHWLAKINNCSNFEAVYTKISYSHNIIFIFLLFNLAGPWPYPQLTTLI